MARPSCTPGFSCGGTSGPHERTIASVCFSKVAMSMPAAAAGTSPNGDSTEYRPPMLGSPWKMRANPCLVATFSSDEPGSVTAMNRCPALSAPIVSETRAKK